MKQFAKHLFALLGAMASLAAFASPALADTIYFPLVTVGGGHTTEFTIVNGEHSAAGGTLRFFMQDGQPWQLAINNQQTADFPLNLPPSGSVRLVASRSGPEQTGWAALETNSNLRAVATWYYFQGDQLASAIEMAAVRAGKSFMLPVDTTYSDSTSIVIAHGGEGSNQIGVRLRLFNERGEEIATAAYPIVNSNGAGKQTRASVKELFPGLASGLRGTILVQVESVGEVAASGIISRGGLISLIPLLEVPAGSEDQFGLNGSPSPLVAKQPQRAGTRAAVLREFARVSTSSTLDSKKKSTKATPVQEESAVVPSVSLDSRIYGVTIDNVSKLSQIVDSLSHLSVKPTARIVFDEWVTAANYVQAATAIHNVSYIMGEILDSSAMDQYSLQQYKDRTTEYLNALSGKVDIWEIGNEINGEWLGNISDVREKMIAAYDLVKQRGGRTALTLYYNKECGAPAANEMFAWIDQNVPSRMKDGLAFVFISYYEDDCGGFQPDWPAIFARLAASFPHSKIGIGECGTSKGSQKSTFINRYYKMNIALPNYVGGYFWWYFREDMVPRLVNKNKVNPLWQTLNQAISSGP